MEKLPKSDLGHRESHLLKITPKYVCANSGCAQRPAIHSFKQQFLICFLLFFPHSGIFSLTHPSTISATLSHLTYMYMHYILWGKTYAKASHYLTWRPILLHLFHSVDTHTTVLIFKKYPHSAIQSLPDLYWLPSLKQQPRRELWKAQAGCCSSAALCVVPSHLSLT